MAKGTKSKSSVGMFDFGCCVPTSEVIWLLFVMFVISCIIVIGCCLAAIFNRWVYKRRIRKKCEALRDKYKQEERFKKEMDVQMRQIALRQNKSGSQDGATTSVLQRLLAMMLARGQRPGPYSPDEECSPNVNIFTGLTPLGSQRTDIENVNGTNLTTTTMDITQKPEMSNKCEIHEANRMNTAAVVHTIAKYGKSNAKNVVDDVLLIERTFASTTNEMETKETTTVDTTKGSASTAPSQETNVEIPSGSSRNQRKSATTTAPDGSTQPALTSPLASSSSDAALSPYKPSSKNSQQKITSDDRPSNQKSSSNSLSDENESLPESLVVKKATRKSAMPENSEKSASQSGPTPVYNTTPKVGQLGLESKFPYYQAETPDRSTMSSPYNRDRSSDLRNQATTSPTATSPHFTPSVHLANYPGGSTYAYLKNAHPHKKSASSQQPPASPDLPSPSAYDLRKMSRAQAATEEQDGVHELLERRRQQVQISKIPIPRYPGTLPPPFQAAPMNPKDAPSPSSPL